MPLKNIDAKKITLIALVVSIIDIVLLAFAENWYEPTYIHRLFENGFTHILFLLIVIALFYYSAKVDKKIWFTKYVLSSALILLLALYNLGAINVIFSNAHDAPYAVVVMISLLFIVPIFGILIIISSIERYLKRK